MPKLCYWRWNFDILIFSWCSFQFIGKLTSYEAQLLSGSECSKQAMVTFCAHQSSSLMLHNPLAPAEPSSFHSSDTESVFHNLCDNSKVFSAPSTIMTLTTNILTRIRQKFVTEILIPAFGHFYTYTTNNLITLSALLLMWILWKNSGFDWL